MNAYDITRIRNHPRFLELERKRGSFSTMLCVLMLVIYFSFIFLVAFGHDIVSRPIGGGPLTLAFPLGLGVIVSAIVLTAVYVVRANGEFDRLTREIVGQAEARPVPTGVNLAAGSLR
jgi:uncharacterized membrane protein (DUF485 family)